MDARRKSHDERWETRNIKRTSFSISFSILNSVPHQLFPSSYEKMSPYPNWKSFFISPSMILCNEKSSESVRAHVKLASLRMRGLTLRKFERIYRKLLLLSLRGVSLARQKGVASECAVSFGLVDKTLRKLKLPRHSLCQRIKVIYYFVFCYSRSGTGR